MKMKLVKHGLTVLAAAAAMMLAAAPAHAADKKPNVVMLMSDDVGYSDYGCYGGGTALEGIRRRTLTVSLRKAPDSPAGMARPVARRAGPRS